MLSVAEITAKGEIYQFFASLYLKLPSEKSLEGLISLLPYLTEIFGESKEIIELKELLLAGQQRKEALSEYQQDFYDLFFVPASGRYAPAIESAVRYNKIWGETEIEVKERYRNANYFPEELEIYDPFKWIGMSDQLGFEVGYLAHLCKTETYASMEERKWIEEEKREFLTKNLLPFVEKYLELLTQVGDGTLYLPVTQLLLRFIQLDLEDIENDEVIRYA